jgi:ligand-binding SRPBCC domain-containing protein
VERFEVSGTVNRPVEQVWAAHEDVHLLERISPPIPAIELIDPPSHCRAGARFTVRLKMFPPLVQTDWQVEIIRWDPPRCFVDRQVTGPFLSWEHTHQFSPLTDDTTLIVESIRFELNPLIDGTLVRAALDYIFQWRLRNLVQVLSA